MARKAQVLQAGCQSSQSGLHPWRRSGGLGPPLPVLWEPRVNICHPWLSSFMAPQHIPYCVPDKPRCVGSARPFQEPAVPRGRIPPVPGHSGALSQAGQHGGPEQAVPTARLCQQPGRRRHGTAPRGQRPRGSPDPAGPGKEMPTGVNGIPAAGWQRGPGIYCSSTRALWGEELRGGLCGEIRSVPALL